MGAAITVYKYEYFNRENKGDYGRSMSCHTEHLTADDVLKIIQEHAERELQQYSNETYEVSVDWE